MGKGIGFVTACILLCLCCDLPCSEAQTQKCGFQYCKAFYYSTVYNANISFHYAWSFMGFPTLLMFYSNESVSSSSCSCNDGITVNDDYSINQTYGSVNISGTAKKVAFAIVFRQLIEAAVDSNAAQGAEFFNFTSDINNTYNCFLLNTALPYLIDNTTVNLTYAGSTLFVINKISTSSVAGQMSWFPHTHYTENSTTFDLTFQNFPYKYPSSRIVLEMYVVPGPAFQARGDIQSNHNIDDEYTPSVFETYTYLFGSSYIQWKPISYQDGSRASTASQQANYLTYQGLLPSDRGQLPQGLASAVFGSDANVTRFYMVIGTSGDNTYLSPGYFTWSAVAGYGTPPTEHISTMAIIILCVGFGLPMATVILGTFYVIYKRKPWIYVYSTVASARLKRSGFVPVVNGDN